MKKTLTDRSFKTHGNRSEKMGKFKNSFREDVHRSPRRTKLQKLYTSSTETLSSRFLIGFSFSHLRCLFFEGGGKQESSKGGKTVGAEEEEGDEFSDFEM